MDYLRLTKNKFNTLGLHSGFAQIPSCRGEQSTSHDALAVAHVKYISLFVPPSHLIATCMQRKMVVATHDPGLIWWYVPTVIYGEQRPKGAMPDPLASQLSPRTEHNI